MLGQTVPSTGSSNSEDPITMYQISNAGASTSTNEKTSHFGNEQQNLIND